MSLRRWVAIGVVVAVVGAGFAIWHARRSPEPVPSIPTAGRGIVSGTLALVGGPTNTRTPVPGRISLANIYETGPPTLNVEVGPDGTFSIAVDPGTYQIYGVSPQYNSGDAPCKPSDKTVKVRTDERVVIDVQCQMK